MLRLLPHPRASLALRPEVQGQCVILPMSLISANLFHSYVYSRITKINTEFE